MNFTHDQLRWQQQFDMNDGNTIPSFSGSTNSNMDTLHHKKDDGDDDIADSNNNSHTQHHQHHHHHQNKWKRKRNLRHHHHRHHLYSSKKVVHSTQSRSKNYSKMGKNIITMHRSITLIFIFICAIALFIWMCTTSSNETRPKTINRQNGILATLKNKKMEQQIKKNKTILNNDKNTKSSIPFFIKPTSTTATATTTTVTKQQLLTNQSILYNLNYCKQALPCIFSSSSKNNATLKKCPSLNYGNDLNVFARHFCKTISTTTIQQSPGIFIDIGIRNVLKSHTLFLERCLGWHGICVMAAGRPDLWIQLYETRSSCTIVPPGVNLKIILQRQPKIFKRIHFLSIDVKDDMKRYFIIHGILTIGRSVDVIITKSGTKFIDAFLYVKGYRKVVTSAIHHDSYGNDVIMKKNDDPKQEKQENVTMFIHQNATSFNCL